MGKKTPLYEVYADSGAQFVDFAGWEMPLHFGSQINEHHSVRKEVGVFDVSHMTIVDIEGGDAKTFLQYLLANDVDKIAPGQALYTCMLNEQGGILDDLIVYALQAGNYRVVVNAATREKDLEWIGQHAQNYQVQITERSDLAMVAVQGPHARERALIGLTSGQREVACHLERFHCAEVEDWFIARTGYTGEDGFELMMPAGQVASYWQGLMTAGVTACGLGARDTLRLEAGMNLYGTDMDETVTPLESNLGWSVAWEPTGRRFVGRAVLELQRKEGVQQLLRGLVLEERGVLRPQQAVIFPDGSEGVITSGSFSPTLAQGIALARVPADHAPDCAVIIRDKQVPARVVRPPFVRDGHVAYKTMGK